MVRAIGLEDVEAWVLVGAMVLATGQVGCGKSGLFAEPESDAQSTDSWSVQADTSGPSDAEGTDVPNSDGGPSDADGGAVSCDPNSACCRYWVDLKIRRNGMSVAGFGGVVETANREIAVQCPEPARGAEGYRCNYSRFGDPGDAGSVPSSVRVDVGPAGRGTVDGVDVHVAGSDASFEGRIDLQPYAVDRAGETCRGSRGTVALEETDIDEDPADYRFGDVSESCTDANERQMTLDVRTNEGACEAGNGPCVVIQLTGDNLPGRMNRTGSYQFGPNHADGRGEICRNGTCREVSGVVVFESFIAGEASGGYWQVELPDGRTLQSRFSASAAGAGFGDPCD